MGNAFVLITVTFVSVIFRNAPLGDTFGDAGKLYFNNCSLHLVYACIIFEVIVNIVNCSS